jgi:hypothetical protein
VHALVEQVLSLEAENSEDDCARVDGREGVAGGDQQNVADAVRAWRVVAAERNDRAEGETVRVEHLNYGIDAFRNVTEEYILSKKKREF